MQYLGHTYSKKKFIYLKIKFNWTSCIIPANPKLGRLDGHLGSTG